ncbi:CheW domain protein [hydrothermal vent metagenome]|uniref:CheW domain protein n=1 Tax=hydrothermal vent metagenome TaxID=652676 RepID=A0A3B0Y8B1_9ZZZZ
MKTGIRDETLLEQKLALSAYLDALLTDETESLPKADAPVEVLSPAATPEPVTESPQPLRVDGVPDWAQTRFQALLFEVAGLTLAVPLVKLKGVVPNEHGLTEMPGHSSLFLGVTPYQGVQSKVVDTARFVLPKDRVTQLDEDISERSAHLVVIDEGRWSLACTKIGDVIELDAEQVKWRSAAGKRLWLAGTVINQMCALLDIDELTQQLVDGMA